MVKWIHSDQIYQTIIILKIKNDVILLKFNNFDWNHGILHNFLLSETKGSMASKISVKDLLQCE